MRAIEVIQSDTHKTENSDRQKYHRTPQNDVQYLSVLYRRRHEGLMYFDYTGIDWLNEKSIDQFKRAIQN